MLPGEDRNFTRLQPDSGEAPQEAVERHIFSDVRRPAESAGEAAGPECLPYGDGNAANGEGGFYRGERRICRAQREIYRSGAQLRRPQTFRLSDAAGVAASYGSLARRKR